MAEQEAEWRHREASLKSTTVSGSLRRSVAAPVRRHAALRERSQGADRAGRPGLASCFVSYRTGLRQRSQHTPRAIATTPGSSFFLSGVMGGSGGGASNLAGVAVESQSYRARIREAILSADPSATVVDPAEIVAARAPELHPVGGAVDWASDAAVATMFGECVDLAARCDVVVSYLPMASMGSAVELHAARARGRLVLVVAPGEKMRSNWVIRAYADRVFEDIDGSGAGCRSTQGPRERAADARDGGGRRGGRRARRLHHVFVFCGRRRVAPVLRGGLGPRVRADKGAVVFTRCRAAAASLGVGERRERGRVAAAQRARRADTVMLCLLTEDVDGCLARLRALELPGVVVEQPPKANAAVRHLQRAPARP